MASFRCWFAQAADKIDSGSELIEECDNVNINVNVNMKLSEIAYALNWPEIMHKIDRENGFSELFRIISLYLGSSSIVSNPSDCWLLLAKKNYDQLLLYGYHNFKRTIGNNYFNFLVQEGDVQITAIESIHEKQVIDECKEIAVTIPNDPAFHLENQATYYYFLLLLWEYISKIDIKRHYLELDEPLEGNPVIINYKGKMVSQDLANSLIEYYAMSEHVNFKHIQRVLEIGGGYGRDAYVILKLNPHIKVILVDITPAIYIAQRYLSSVFSDRKIFRVRKFSTYEEVRREMEEASIVFLMPDQLSLLPDNQIDLSINISSFGEMAKNQLEWYFEQLGRVTKRYFYTKQWKNSKNPYDGIELSESDYPVPSTWNQIYSRTCVVQSEFFETLYAVNRI